MSGKHLKYLVLVVVGANFALIAVVFLGASKPAVKPMPNPNGFVSLVQAAQMVSGVGNVSSNTPEAELRDLVSKNFRALDLARQGLGDECRVPNDYSPNYLGTYMPVMASFKSLAQLLCANGLLAEKEQRTNDAAQFYLQAIELGQNGSRGGLIIWRLVGIAGEAIGARQLERLTNSLDATQSRNVARQLEKIDADEESFADTLQNEAAWRRKVFGLKGELSALATWKIQKQSHAKVVQKIQANQIHRRQMLVAFAARAWLLNHGKNPAGLADLVPDYLKAIPQNPTMNTNLDFTP